MTIRKKKKLAPKKGRSFENTKSVKQGENSKGWCECRKRLQKKNVLFLKKKK
jgi:hypothetical protein